MALAHGQKRSRSDADRTAFAAGQHHQRFHFVGSETPADDRGARASQLSRPAWQQDALDERGRKRFHGAFTGGFSAGYFNTVGSKEGFTPTSFVSSRSNRAAAASHSQDEQKRREALMDEEDLADAAAAQTLHTVDVATLSAVVAAQSDGCDRLSALFRSDVDTAASRALKSLGWTPSHHASAWAARTEPSRRGAGFDDGGQGAPKRELTVASPSTAVSGPRAARSAAARFQLGNSDSDDDLDSMGPKLTLHRKAANLKKTKKPSKPAVSVTSANPSLTSRPVLKPRGAALASSTPIACYDGRPPLAGFLLVESMQTLSQFLLEMIRLQSKYAQPKMDPAWASTNLESPPANADQTEAFTTPEERASHMGWGEGKKSVFDYLSSSARDKIVTASGRQDLPEGRGERPVLTGSSKAADNVHLDSLRLITKDAANAVRARAQSGWTLYQNDSDKQRRFITFLDFCSGGRPDLPGFATTLTRQPDAPLQELQEFASASAMFKPMSELMASRFTTSLGTSAKLTGVPNDPAQDAADAGMFGPLTRRVFGFYPVSLVCRRFDIPQPPIPADVEEKDLATNKAGLLPANTMDQIRCGQGVSPRGTVDESLNASIEGPKATDEVFEQVFGGD